MPDTFYITTTLPYVNAEPHIGFALEINAADVIARYQKLQGKDIIFNTGTDEHGQKIYQKALEQKKSPQNYVDEYAAKFDQLKQLLNLSYNHFIRTTDSHHVKAAQEFWRLCDQNGDIYKKLYPVKYCIGCELEKTDSELQDGKCPLHPNRELEIREEENYFFKFSNYQDKLLKLYTDNPNFVVPTSKLNEIKSFVEQGLQDFSISRLKSKMPWGVPVPGDDGHVMYVWFDALVNYISTVGWPNDTQQFQKYWPGIQIAGKDNLRQQSAMWQAMLFSAGLPNSQQILINGFISVDGQKMSKSLGNVIAPQDLVDRYGIDGARYILTAIGPVNGDIDVTWEKFDTIYTSALSNGLGNLVSRVAKLAQKNQTTINPTQPQISPTLKTAGYHQHFKDYQLHLVLEEVWREISNVDKKLDQTQPWTLQPDQANPHLQEYIQDILNIAYALKPFLPQTSNTILNHFQGPKVEAIDPIFPRLK